VGIQRTGIAWYGSATSLGTLAVPEALFQRPRRRGLVIEGVEEVYSELYKAGRTDAKSAVWDEFSKESVWAGRRADRNS
jgi:hypothetical protein